MNIITANLGPMQHGKYPFFFITGSTGSGKTYIIHLLINWLKLHQQKYMFASINGSYSTKHRWLHYSFSLTTIAISIRISNISLRDPAFKRNYFKSNNYYRWNFNGFNSALLDFISQLFATIHNNDIAGGIDIIATKYFIP